MKGSTTDLFTPTLSGVILVAVFLISAVTGFVAPYIAILAGLLALPLVWRPGVIGPALTDTGMRLFLLAFVLLVLAFALSAREIGDIAAAGDFAILLLGVAVYALFRRTANTNGALIIAVVAWAGAFVTAAGGSYEVYVLGVERASGGSNAMYYSEIGAMLGMLALLGVFAPGPRWRWALVSGPALSLGCVQLGGTRGALLGVAVLLCVFVTAALLRWPRYWRHIVLGTGALLGVIALIAAVVFDLSRLTAVPGLLWQALESGSTADGSVNIRLQFYSAGLQAFAESPIHGYGWWQRFIAIEPYLATDAARAFSGPLGHLHNDVLNFATAAGVLGLLAYVLMLVAPAISAWRSPRDSQWWFRIVASISLAAGFFAFGLSDALFVVEVTRTVYILGAVAILGFCRDEPLRP